MGRQPRADGASAPCSWSKPEGGEQLAGRPRRPGVRLTGVTETCQPGPAEGQYAQHQHSAFNVKHNDYLVVQLCDGGRNLKKEGKSILTDSTGTKHSV